MLSREDVVAWVAIRQATKHAEKRVTDGGFAFWVDTQPDDYHDGYEHAMTYGNGPSVVVKRTGAVWNLASNPGSLPIYGAKSEQELHATMKEAGMDPGTPHEWIGGQPQPEGVTQQGLARWLQWFGWQPNHYGVTDLGYAFAVLPTPAVVHNGPVIVVKHSGDVWYLGSAPQNAALVLGTRTETEFHQTLGVIAPGVNPRQPHDRIS